MKNKEAYLSSPSKCPYCDSEDIESGALDADGAVATAEVECNNCHKSWTDVYRLVDVYHWDEQGDDAEIDSVVDSVVDKWKSMLEQQ